jgi:hypothetical protein
MTRSDRVYTPRPNTSAIDVPPRALTSQERGDFLLMQWRLERAAALRMAAAGIPADRRLTPQHILADFLEGELLVPNPDAMAKLILERLNDAGFEIEITADDRV